MPSIRRASIYTALVAALTTALGGGCANPKAPADPTRQEIVFAVTANAEIIKFVAGQPGTILNREPLVGLPEGERIVGIDFRVARGVLYALSSSGRLYTLDASYGHLKPVGKAPLTSALASGPVGFDFNPAADRIRVVGADGTNLRLHPESGAVAAVDGLLHYGPGDTAYAKPPRLGSAAYTYNKTDERLTTNYAIDLERGTLVTQGTVERATPAVSPNTGRLFTVGELGTGRLDGAAFDIADIDNTALAALRHRGRTHLHVVDLATGKARDLGPIGDGGALWGLAILP